MKIPVIKKLVEIYDETTLRQAESALINEENLPVEIDGEDDGEKLTHVIAALWVHDRLKKGDTDIRSAIREYTQKVRGSIS